MGCSLPLLPGSAPRFGLLFRVDAARLRAVTDREISTRRAQTWQKMLRDLRFARIRNRATARGRRETTPTRIGTIGSFWVELPGGSRHAPPRRDESRDLEEKSLSLAKDIPKSAFWAHPGSRRRAREARNQAALYRNNWIILGGAARRKPPCGSAPRQIARFDFGVLDTQHLVPVAGGTGGWELQGVVM